MRNVTMFGANSRPQVAAAPTGPYGIATDNVKLWLAAYNLELSNGAAVSSWTDFGPLGLDAVQATGTQQPTFVTNVLNGQPCVRFDAVNDVLTTANMDMSDTDKFMVFIVLTVPSGTGRIIYESGAGDAGTITGAFQCFRQASDDMRILHSGNGGAAEPQLGSAANPQNTTAKYWTFIHDFSQPAGSELAMRMNGSDLSGTVVNGSTDNTDTGFGNLPFNVGARSGGSIPSGADIYEIIIIKGLDTTTRNTIEAGQSALFGI